MTVSDHGGRESEELTDRQREIIELASDMLSFKPLRPLFQVTPYNWKPILYIAMLTSLKYVDDRYFWNIDLVEKLRLFDIKATNKFEHLFLNLLDFELYVSQSEFEEYFKWLILYSKFREREDSPMASFGEDQKMDFDN